MSATNGTQYKRPSGANGYAKPTPADLSEYTFGKVQPQAVELEQAVLGALMLDREALSIVTDILRPESFYTDAHQNIYRAILGLSEKNNPVDLLTITEELRKSGELANVGGGYYLTELSSRVASSANIEYHARIIAQKFIQREIIRIGTQAIRDAYMDVEDVFEMLEKAEKGFFDISMGTGSQDAQSAWDITMQVIGDVGNAMKQREAGHVPGVPSGLQAIDNETGGWQSPDLILIAARPGMGKTALVLTVAINAARAGKPVALFSLEMSKKQLIARGISAEAQVDSRSMKNGKLHDSDLLRIQEAGLSFEKLPLYIDDTPALSLQAFRAKARRLKLKYGISLFIIDYVQLMTNKSEQSKNGNREQEIASIARGLKETAKELDTPIIALAQLSRAVEIRGGSKRPQLSDLRESGALEQDADIVGFIYRPEYYGILEDENGKSLKGIAEIIFAKHRDGALFTAILKFTEQFAQFSDVGGTMFPVAQPSTVINNRQEPNADLPF